MDEKMHPKAQPAEETMSEKGPASLNLPLRPKMSNQCIKTDVASCVSLGPKGRMFSKKFYLLQSARFLKAFGTNLQQDMTYMPLPFFLSAFLLLKCICTCKTQTVLCVYVYDFMYCMSNTFCPCCRGIDPNLSSKDTQPAPQHYPSLNI